MGAYARLRAEQYRAEGQVMVRPWPHWGACVALGRAIDIWLSLTDVSPEAAERFR